jgi:hypothetical protein
MMKLGMLTSLGLVLVFCLIAYFTFFGVADAPTRQTSANTLIVVSLPGDLPKLYSPSNPDEDASVPYIQAFQFYLKNRDAFNLVPESAPPKELSKKLIDKMIEAMNAGKVPESFLDNQFPYSLIERPKYEDALEMVPFVLLWEANNRLRDDDKARAFEATKAAFALLDRAYRKNHRFEVRGIALQLMNECGNTMFALTDGEGELFKRMQKYQKPIKDVELHWQSKMEVIGNIRPHIGDVINMARNDQDLTFRIRAVQWLAVAKFRPGGRGNVRAIAQAIADAKLDPNPMIQDAAKMAEQFTIQEYRKIK